MTSRTAQARRAPKPAPPRQPTRVLLLALAGVVLVVAVGLVVALSGGGDDAPAADTDASLVFGTVSVEGTALRPFQTSESDPSVGEPGPVLSGEAADGTAVTVGGAGEPTFLVFLAHWCPHCQAELPVLVDVEASGGFAGVRTVAVLTGTNADAPNYPPAPWLDREGWKGDVLVDDKAFTAAAAYGLAGYPFIVALDAEGNVVGRTSGEVPADAIEALAAEARGEG